MSGLTGIVFLRTQRYTSEDKPISEILVDNNVIVSGSNGVGKTTAATLLIFFHGMEERYGDSFIEGAYNDTISKIFALLGKSDNSYIIFKYVNHLNLNRLVVCYLNQETIELNFLFFDNSQDNIILSILEMNHKEAFAFNYEHLLKSFKLQLPKNENCNLNYSRYKDILHSKLKKFSPHSNAFSLLGKNIDFEKISSQMYRMLNSENLNLNSFSDSIASDCYSNLVVQENSFSADKAFDESFDVGSENYNSIMYNSFLNKNKDEIFNISKIFKEYNDQELPFLLYYKNLKDKNTLLNNEITDQEKKFLFNKGLVETKIKSNDLEIKNIECNLSKNKGILQSIKNDIEKKKGKISKILSSLDIDKFNSISTEYKFLKDELFNIENSKSPILKEIESKMNSEISEVNNEHSNIIINKTIEYGKRQDVVHSKIQDVDLEIKKHEIENELKIESFLNQINSFACNNSLDIFVNKTNHYEVLNKIENNKLIEFLDLSEKLSIKNGELNELNKQLSINENELNCLNNKFQANEIEKIKINASIEGVKKQKKSKNVFSYISKHSKNPDFLAGVLSSEFLNSSEIELRVVDIKDNQTDKFNIHDIEFCNTGKFKYNEIVECNKVLEKLLESEANLLLEETSLLENKSSLLSNESNLLNVKDNLGMELIEIQSQIDLIAKKYDSLVNSIQEINLKIKDVLNDKTIEKFNSEKHNLFIELKSINFNDKERLEFESIRDINILNIKNMYQLKIKSMDSEIDNCEILHIKNKISYYDENFNNFQEYKIYSVDIEDSQLEFNLTEDKILIIELELGVYEEIKNDLINNLNSINKEYVIFSKEFKLKLNLITKDLERANDIFKFSKYLPDDPNIVTKIEGLSLNNEFNFNEFEKNVKYIKLFVEVNPLYDEVKNQGIFKVLFETNCSEKSELNKILFKNLMFNNSRVELFVFSSLYGEANYIEYKDMDFLINEVLTSVNKTFELKDGFVGYIKYLNKELNSIVTTSQAGINTCSFDIKIQDDKFIEFSNNLNDFHEMLKDYKSINGFINSSPQLLCRMLNKIVFSSRMVTDILNNRNNVMGKSIKVDGFILVENRKLGFSEIFGKYKKHGNIVSTGQKKIITYKIFLTFIQMMLKGVKTDNFNLCIPFDEAGVSSDDNVKTIVNDFNDSNGNAKVNVLICLPDRITNKLSKTFNNNVYLIKRNSIQKGLVNAPQ